MYYSNIKAVKTTARGTDIVVEIPGKNLKDKILKYKATTAEIRIVDDRTISPKQRRMIYATIKDISLHTGDDPEYLKEFLKFDYCGEYGEQYFSLSNCSIDIAREFIEHLTDFVLKHNIPLSDLAINRTESIDKYLYGCIKYRRCAITGEPGADIHHCIGSKVGMGGNRRKISNKGRKLIALSRKWHNKVEEGEEFKVFKDHHVYGIELDNETLKALGLSSKDIS